MKITDKKIIEDVLKIRAEELRETKQKIILDYKKDGRDIPDDKTLYDLTISKVSNRKHPKTREKIKEKK